MPPRPPLPPRSSASLEIDVTVTQLTVKGEACDVVRVFTAWLEGVSAERLQAASIGRQIDRLDSGTHGLQDAVHEAQAPANPQPQE